MAPSHPALAARSLILHAGRDPGVAVAELDRRIVGAIAVPVDHAAAQTGLIAGALGAGLGVVLPAEPGLPADAEDALDAQLSAGATLALTPAHRDLGLVHATIAAWEARQGWRPPPQRADAGSRRGHTSPAGDGLAGGLRGAYTPPGVDGLAGGPRGAYTPPGVDGPAGGPRASRELYATVVVDGADVEAVTGPLIDAYAPLAVAGYWLIVSTPGRTQRQLGAVARLALGLQQHARRPVVMAGLDDAHLALLASGMAAVCAGPHDDGVFHPAILSSLPGGARYAPVRRRLFQQRPCPCGAHPPAEPPTGEPATGIHNRYHLQAEALEAAAMAPAIAETRLLARASRASRLRRELRLGPLGTGWQGVPEAARDRRSDAGQMTG